MSSADSSTGRLAAAAPHDRELFAKWIAVLFIVGYIVVFWFFRTLLPEKWTIDSDKILGIAAQGEGSADNSYAATAFLFMFIGERNVDLLVFTVGTSYLLLAFRGISGFNREFLVRLAWIIPCLTQALFIANKETIVLSMTLIIVGVWLTTKSTRWTCVALLVLYGAYGGLVRIYYLIIILVIAYLLILYQLRGSARILWLLAPIVGIFLAPNSLLEQIQGQRDSMNAWAVNIGSDNRTAFNNLVPPTSSINFLINYVYAAAVLLLPFLFFYSIKELLLFGCILGQASLIRFGWRQPMSEADRSVVRLFTTLLLGHFFTQVLFEPDLGSFVRHLSSASLYMVPIHLTVMKNIHAAPSPAPQLSPGDAAVVEA
jgi:hypothetical protein